MSGPKYFAVEALNPYEDKDDQPDLAIASQEYDAIKAAIEQSGIQIVHVDEPEGCQDGVYTANWGLCRGDTCVLSVLPNRRKAEEPYAEKVLKSLGKNVIKAPYHFSGQGDNLPCGNLLFSGSGYRTDPRMHDFLADKLGYDVIRLQAVPAYDQNKNPITNKVTGWPDSYFYDIDLAISVLREDLIAWCPEAFMPDSQERIRSLDIKTIEVSLEEALYFGCNNISSGKTVIMGNDTPKLKTAIETHGLRVNTIDIKELAKGGGFIRCTTLTLDNE